jgi:GT2 family glycosyltransferase
VFGACAAAALYRRPIFDEIGYFDEDFFCIYEDVDLSFRAQLAGHKCLYVPKAIVYHRVGGTAGMDNDFTVYYGQRNLESVFLKNMPFPLLVKYLPLHVGYVVLAFVYNLLRKKGRIFLRSKMDALKQIKLTLQKRKNIQIKRKVSSGDLEMVFDQRSLFQHRAGIT